MKIQNIFESLVSKKILLVVLALFLIQIVYAGVTNPLPTELKLLPGESGRFKFQIQTVASEQNLSCTYSLENESSFLEVDFDDTEVMVPAGEVRDVYGTVFVPESVDYGNYGTNFCVSCNPVSEEPGTSVKVDTCDLPINVNVVSDREKENMNVPSKPMDRTMITIIAGLVLLIVIGLIYYLLGTKKSKKKK